MARRGNKEGSIYRRGDGRWAATVTGQEGKRKTYYAKSRAEVGSKLLAAQRALSDGLPLGREHLTLGRFLEDWLENSARPALRPRTFDSYRMIVRQHLEPALGNIRLVRLTPEAVQRYLKDKQESGLSARTVQYHHAVLRRALVQAERWGRVARNVAKLVSPPRVIRPEVRPPTVEQAQAFLRGVRGDRLQAIYAVALGLGLRQGEVLGLTWPDIDLDARTLSIRQTLQRYERAYHLDEPKTLRSRRTVALPPAIVEALKAHRIQQLKERLAAGASWKGDEWHLVFTTEMGEPLCGNVVTHHFQETLDRLELPRWRFHDCRHAAATFMLAQGVPLRVAMEILGHSNITVTANTYSHVLPQLQREATEKVGAALFGES
jgi:integrase